MKKDAFYFPHYCNARHDRKIKRVIKELGVEGYGIYFMLLEVLREQTDFKFPMDDIDLLADEFGTSEQKVRTVICNYQLFEVDEQHRFFSMKLVFYLQPYLEKSERARIAANTRWEATKNRQLNEPSNANAYANAMQEESESNADAMQVKKSKQKKSKESKVFIPPTLQDIQEYILEKEYNVDANKFFDYYDSANWTKANGEKVLSWKQTIVTWNNKEQGTTKQPSTLKGLVSSTPNPTKRVEEWK